MELVIHGTTPIIYKENAHKISHLKQQVVFSVFPKGRT